MASAWRSRACEAWLAGDTMCRDLVGWLGLERLTAAGQSKGGGWPEVAIVRSSVGPAGNPVGPRSVPGRSSLRTREPLDSLETSKVLMGGWADGVFLASTEHYRQPPAGEVVREIGAFRDLQSRTLEAAGLLGGPKPARNFGANRKMREAARASANPEEARREAATADAGAALAGMIAARRLWDRDAWILLCRRAVVAILAVATSRETVGRSMAYPEATRRKTARGIALVMSGGRARRLELRNWEPARPLPEAGAAATLEIAQLLVEGWSEAAAELGVWGCARTAPQVRPSTGARAARLRGFEEDQIGEAPGWAFDPHYSAAELEEAHPAKRGSK